MMTIYGLFIDDRCVYVGRTKDLTMRTASNNRRCMRLFGKVPEVRALRRVHPNLASKAEWDTIKDFKLLGQAELNKLCGKRHLEGAKSTFRTISLYKEDYDFFSQLSEQHDRSLPRMFRHLMAQLRSGQSIASVNNEKAA